MMGMNNMVTIELLQKSQRSRPRKWIPVYCFIVGLLLLLAGGFYAILLFPEVEFCAAFIAALPKQTFTVSEIVYDVPSFLLLIGMPIGMFVLAIFGLFVVLKICNARLVYWWIGFLILIGFIAEGLLTLYFSLYYLVPFLKKSMTFMQGNLLNILTMVWKYTNLGTIGLMFLFLLLGLFYNVNYPAKYEAIYDLRKKRIKSYHNLDEREAYKKRFYKDYKEGNWISMMADLHADALDTDSNDPMRKDAYEFLVYRTCLSDNNVREAVLNQFASEGRYYECRKYYREAVRKSEIVENASAIHLPRYQPKPVTYTPKPAPKQEKIPEPTPVLKPRTYTHEKAAKFSGYTPEDI